jgi:hypothetical protein
MGGSVLALIGFMGVGVRGETAGSVEISRNKK